MYEIDQDLINKKVEAAIYNKLAELKEEKEYKDDFKITVEKFIKNYNYINISSLSIDNYNIELCLSIIDGLYDTQKIIEAFVIFLNTKYTDKEIEKIKVYWEITPVPESYAKQQIDKIKNQKIIDILIVLGYSLMYLAGSILIYYYFFK